VLVLNNKKVMFIHIQKTGGTWIEEVLTQLGVKWSKVGMPHITIAKARKMYPNNFAFTSIRNPLTWYQY
jgi:hypothetical protein